MNRKVWQIPMGLLLGAALGLVCWAGSRELLSANHLEALESPLVPRDVQQSLKEPYRFVALGDWGAGTPFQKDVAAQLNLQYDKEPFDSVILLGDNIYPDGNIRKHGQAYFTDMYSHLIKEGVNFIVAIGNHDVVMGHQADQLSFFKLPGYYYAIKKPGVEFFVLNTNSFAKEDVQQKWLDNALKSSKSHWKIVIGHHPIYSSGEHGMNKGLKATLEPLLLKYKVDLYLAGHDHDYERFKPIQGVQHIVSGGGGAYLRNFETLLPGSLVHLKAHHFLSFDLKGNDLKMLVIDKTGKTIDQAEWHKAAELPKKQTEKHAS